MARQIVDDIMNTKQRKIYSNFIIALCLWTITQYIKLSYFVKSYYFTMALWLHEILDLNTSSIF